MLKYVVEGVVGDGEHVKSIGDDVGGGAAADDDDDDELGKKPTTGLEEWISDLEMNFLLGGIVEEVVNRRMWEVSALLLLYCGAESGHRGAHFLYH